MDDTSHNEGLRRRLLQGLAVAERRLCIGEIQTSLLEAGQGPPLVLLHGGIECGGVYWAPVIARLAEHFRVIVPDVPGLGESAPAAQLDDEVFSTWLLALLRHTCSRPPTLVAHSLLGTFAARFAAGHPQTVRRMVVYGAPGVGRYRMPLRLIVTAIRFDLRPTARNGERFERLAFLDRDRVRARDSDWFNAFRAYSLSRARVPHVKRTMRQLIKAGTKQIPDSVLRCLDTTTELIWGRQDRFVSLRLAEGATAKFRWPLHIVERSGHVPHIEQPEQFLAALDRAI